jgi:hypothetical protein
MDIISKITDHIQGIISLIIFAGQSKREKIIFLINHLHCNTEKIDEACVFLEENQQHL